MFVVGGTSKLFWQGPDLLMCDLAFVDKDKGILAPGNTKNGIENITRMADVCYSCTYIGCTRNIVRLCTSIRSAYSTPAVKVKENTFRDFLLPCVLVKNIFLENDCRNMPWCVGMPCGFPDLPFAEQAVSCNLLPLIQNGDFYNIVLVPRFRKFIN